MNSQYRKPFLDFYIQNDVCPVSQDIGDIGKHFDRRAALYRHLGIPPALLRNRSIIEFGPGSGHNAVFTCSLAPGRYVLVDGNPSALENTRNRLKPFSKGPTEFRYVEAEIEDYQDHERFDVVLCEGVIPCQKDPETFLRRVAQFAKSGGLVVITCMDSVSFHSEIIRRLIGNLLTNAEDPLAVNVQKLLPVFSPHLATLKGMSRPHDEWIMDNILQPNLGRLFSIKEAILAVYDNFDVYGCSPHFALDWRWYKDIYGHQKQYNEMVINEYEKKVHRLMDYRVVSAPRSVQENRCLVKTCDTIADNVFNFEKDKQQVYINEIMDALKELAVLVHAFSPQTSLSIQDVTCTLERFNGEGSFPSLKHFATFFGRGQQYLSFIRR